MHSCKIIIITKIIVHRKAIRENKEEKIAKINKTWFFDENASYGDKHKAGKKVENMRTKK